MKDIIEFNKIYCISFYSRVDIYLYAETLFKIYQDLFKYLYCYFFINLLGTLNLKKSLVSLRMSILLPPLNINE